MYFEKPNYAEYTKQELLEALQHLDRDRFPERLNLIQEELNRRAKIEDSAPVIDDMNGWNIFNSMYLYQTLFACAGLGLLLSALVHLTAVAGLPMNNYPYFWMLHLGVFFIFFPFVIALKNSKHPDNAFGELTHIVPTKGLVFLAGLVIYAFVNFGIFMAKSQGGAPDIWNDAYVLQNKGKFIKYITEAEYYALVINEFRGFSGHWMFFYGLPMCFFFYKVKHIRNANAVSKHQRRQ